jgi:hypothetical protein
MRWIALLAFLWCAPAVAQNTTCATRATGDSSNACASTAFVAATQTALLGSNNTWTGTNDFEAAVGIVSGFPFLYYDENDAGVDSRIWESYVNGSTYHFGTNNDVFGASVDAFTITRTANLPTAFTVVPVLKSTGGVQITQVAIASLPTCNAANIGMLFVVNNGTAYGTGTYGSAVSATGIVTRSVLCTNTAGATTYAWAYN